MVIIAMFMPGPIAMPKTITVPSVCTKWMAGDAMHVFGLKTPRNCSRRLRSLFRCIFESRGNLGVLLPPWIWSIQGLRITSAFPSYAEGFGGARSAFHILHVYGTRTAWRFSGIAQDFLGLRQKINNLCRAERVRSTLSWWS